MPLPLLRVLRLALAGLAAAVLVTTLAPSGQAAPAPTPAAAPTDPAGPTDPVGACPPDEGIVLDGTLTEDIGRSDGHAAAASSSLSSFGAGCSPVPEQELGSGAVPPQPQDLDPDADDWNDPFDRSNGFYLGFQFGNDGGPPGYWEQPIAPRVENAEKLGSQWPGGIAYLAVISPAGGGRREVAATLPPYDGCRWHTSVPATRMPGEVASWAGDGRRVYPYDHVPMRIGSRKFAREPGRWFHYLCGAATPGHVTGPPAGSRLSDLEANYYLTPHWVYSVSLTAAELDTAGPAMRAARSLVHARVVTSPGEPYFQGVTRLKTWMWTDARRYEFALPGRRAVVEPTGIRVVAPDVPLVAHDIRRGGCRTGGRPDTGDSAADTDCYLTFTRATRAGEFFPVGFAVRWQVTVSGVRLPLTFWTTTVQNYAVRDVQVLNGS